MMKRLQNLGKLSMAVLPLLAVIISLSIEGCTEKQGNDLKTLSPLTQYVDPQIGSVHGRWFFYTPAALPFGMAKLAPHTNAYNSMGGWGPTGYDDRHTSIEGFGHFHEFQIGGLVFMPITGRLKTIPGSLESPDQGYRSRFDKSTETARPGYYQVLLEDYDIKVELTATERVGYQRYTFPESKKIHVILDIGHKQGESSDVTEAHAELLENGEIEGFIQTYPEYAKFGDPGKKVTMYFVTELSKEPVEFGAFRDSLIQQGVAITGGIDNGLYLTYNMKQDEILEIRTGLSYTSIANARNNLYSESEGKNFESIQNDAEKKWNEKLNKIVVEGGRKEDRIKFYTGLYHALLGRGLSSDINGDYPLVDDNIGRTPSDEKGIPKYHHYNTDGMWGGFWNLSQLWSLAYPDYFSDYIQSNIDFYKDRGWLHDGAAAGVFTNGVSTNFQGLLMASAYNIGIRDFEIQTGYEAALKNELDYRGRDLGNGKYDLSYFVRDGFIPYKDTLISNGWVFNFGGSHMLEYSFSSYAVANMSEKMGDEENQQKLMRQAGYYLNLFDSSTKLMRPRLPDGSFIEDFDPMKAWKGFQEGNAYQYTWYVPHDPAGLIGLLGAPLFNERLETMFNEAHKTMFGGGADEIHSFSGVEKLYNHGNQPSLHNAWLFNYSGKPWLTQKWVRNICNEFYGVEPLHGYGIGQDEDQGQLGAWYVIASMGLFDVQGLTSSRPSIQLGSPLFDKITISLDQNYFSGKLLTIETRNQHPDNHFIQSATWNGRELNNHWLYHDELMKGGTLAITLGKDPNKSWGAGSPPPSMSDEK